MDSPETRITTAIQGIPGGKYQFADIRTIYERYMGWLENPEVCLLHFEDLTAIPEQQLNRVIDHLQARGYEPQEPRQTLLDTLIRQMDPSKSPTFRQGKSGGWREHFTPVHKALFKDLAGDLLIRLGYEKDLDW
jgi:hypothetical protein